MVDVTRVCVKIAAFGAAVLTLTAAARAQEFPRPTLNLYGAAGGIDMPSGQPAPDGEYSTTHSRFAGISRTTLSFQLAPRLSGSFRYTGILNWNFGGFDTYYDRSFDARYQLLKESEILPSVTIGLQDFLGTGLFSGEYVAATKNLTPKFRVTGGIGWGRLGSYNSVGSPFGERPTNNIGLGGKANYAQWFRGPMAPFGGVEWQATDKISLKAEYSSDAYTSETGPRDIFIHKSPWNFGVGYQLSERFRFGAYYLYGSEVGVTGQLLIDPSRRPRNMAIQGMAPFPVAVRPSRTAQPQMWSQDWVNVPGLDDKIKAAVAPLLAADDMMLERLTLSATRAELRFRNKTFGAEAQAIGRAARALSRVLPASVETFDLIPVVKGMPLTRVTLQRSDLEALEFAPQGEAALRLRVSYSDVGGVAEMVSDDNRQPLTWGLRPFTRFSFFDPGNPVRMDVGVRLSGNYEISPNLILSGAFAQKAGGNLDQARASNTVASVQRVRSEATKYNDNDTPVMESMTLAWYQHPARNIYTRLSGGYLERMFGGLSGEVLWRPIDSKLALGAELNYVAQRNTDQRLGFDEYDYRVLTGHVSAYYEFGEGYLAQLDAGRYLAGDIGATFTLAREFDSGWRIGAFATLTDMSAEDFGEGSFDKGINLTIPLNWLTGYSSRKVYSTTIRPVTRDGGARLAVNGRLNALVRDYHTKRMDAQWERVLR